MTRRRKGLLDGLALNIAYSTDLRGPNDDEPCLVFIGATRGLLQRVFGWLCAGGHAARDFRIEEEHACVYRNGKAYWRLVVTLIDRRTDFLSDDALRTLVEARIHAEGHRIRYVSDYEKFINL